MQTELPFISVLSSQINELEWSLVARCKTPQEAIRLCVNHDRSQRTIEDLAEIIGLRREALSRASNPNRAGKQRRNLGMEEVKDLERACGNKAVTQWGDLYEKGQLDCQLAAEDEEAILLGRLAEIRAAK